MSSWWRCARPFRASLAAAVGVMIGPGRIAAAVGDELVPESSRSCSRSSAGAATISALIWLTISVVVFDRGPACHPQGADHAHAVLVSLGDPRGLAGEHGPGSGLGIDRIRLAPGVAGLAIGAVDLDDSAAGMTRKRARPAP